MQEQDQLDILGMVSGLGTAESNERAQRLIAKGGEPAKYLVELSNLKEAITTSPPLSFSEASSVIGCVKARAVDVLREQRRIVQHWRRMMLIGLSAAAVAITMGYNWMLVQSVKPVGYATRLLESKVRNPDTNPERVYADQTVESGQNRMILSLDSDTRVLLQRQTVASINDVLILKRGGAYLRGASQSILAGETKTRLKDGTVFIQSSSDGISWHVYTGSVDISVNGRQYAITAGNSGSYNSESKHMATMPLDQVVPIDVDAHLGSSGNGG